MSEVDKFQSARVKNVTNLSADKELRTLSHKWVEKAAVHNWAYNFDWLGRPAIQFPNDTWAMQELIWEVKPDLIIETGIAHGGSLVFSASMLALLDYADAVTEGVQLDPRKSRRKVLGVDIDIREHNRKAIEAHPFSGLIEMIQGSSVAPETVSRVHQIASDYKKIMVCLDSNHTHAHVLAELEAYAPLVAGGSYCVVFDTLVEDMPTGSFPDRPWDKGDNPKTAVYEFLDSHGEFEIDLAICGKLQVTVAPEGFLRRKL